MITLYQFPPCWNLPSASPFCIKLETWLRIASLPFSIEMMSDPRRAPKRKLPFIEDNGKIMADSSLIIAGLKGQYRVLLDAHLNKSQENFALALQRLIEEHLYWSIVYSRWIDSAGWPLTRSAYFGYLPFPVRAFVPACVRNQMKKALYGQGMGRHLPEEIYRLGKQGISVLSDTLGDQRFFFGEQPASLDATAFAFISSIIDYPVDTPLKTHANLHKNLKRYCQNIRQSYY